MYFCFGRKTLSHLCRSNILHNFRAFPHKCVFINPQLLLVLPDNTAGIVTKRSGFRRRLQEIYFLPVVIEDNGYPPKSSTGTLTIRVCGCESDGSLLTCGAEAIFLPVGLSTGALIAILLCIIILLGETSSFSLNICHYSTESLIIIKGTACTL